MAVGPEGFIGALGVLIIFALCVTYGILKWAFTTLYNTRQKIVQTRLKRNELINQLHNELKKIDSILKNTKDKELRILFSEIVEKYKKKSYDEASALIDKLQNLWEQKEKLKLVCMIILKI